MQTALQNITFKSYLEQQKKTIYIAAAAFVVMYILLRWCFPIPDFFEDSHSYILWAKIKMEIAYRPTGYSQFLSFLRDWSSATGFVSTVQFLMHAVATLFFYFSLDYLYGFGRRIKTVILVLLVFNPLLLLQTNLISSDSPFASLTIMWFTVLLWMVHRKNWLMVCLQIILLLSCFIIRYNALFYPVIVLVAVVVSNAKWLFKGLSIAATFLAIFLLVNSIKEKTEKYTGVRIFSAFSGWQIANNSMYARKYGDVDRDQLSEEALLLDTITNMYIDSAEVTFNKDAQPVMIGTQFMWNTKSPLKVYLYTYLNRHPGTGYFEGWNAASVTLNEYGWHVIKNNPGTFVKYFMAVNFYNYFYPPLECMRNYDRDKLPVPPDTKEWFELESDKLYCTFPGLQAALISVYPFLALPLNLFCIASVVIFLFLLWKERKTMDINFRVLGFTWSAFYLVNMAFSVFAGIVTLRYLNPVFALGLSIPFLIFQYARRRKKVNKATVGK